VGCHNSLKECDGCTNVVVVVGLEEVLETTRVVLKV
jgi:hypothetical protein